MTLSALIRKRDTGNLATAISAISATQPKGEAATVARIATVAVANPKEEKTAPPAKSSRCWLLHYRDREPVECHTSGATRDDVLRWHPDTIAAEPFKEPRLTAPSALLTAEEETTIRAWLALIEETAPYTIADVLDQCRNDADARSYFMRQSEHEWLPEPIYLDGE